MKKGWKMNAKFLKKKNKELKLNILTRKTIMKRNSMNALQRMAYRKKNNRIAIKESIKIWTKSKSKEANRWKKHKNILMNK